MTEDEMYDIIRGYEESERDYHERNIELEAENARLRELIADTLLDPREYCEKYGIKYEGWDSANAHIDKRMIELGVDVRK